MINSIEKYKITRFDALNITYQTQIKENLRYSPYMLAGAADYLPLNQALKNFWYERLRQHLVLNILMVPKTGLNQVFKEDQHELLSVALLTYFELVRNLVDEDYHG